MRRLRWPLAALAVPLVLRLALAGLGRAEVAPEAIFPLTMVFQIALLFALLFAAVWFVFLSGLPTFVRVGGVLAGIGLAVAAGLTVQSVEFDGQMNPRLRWRGEPTAAEQFAAFQQTAPKGVGGADLTPGPADSPHFRGHDADAVALADDWSKTPPKVLWRHPVGDGHAGTAVAGNCAVTVEQRGGDETVVCYDRATGAERWAAAVPAAFTHTAPMGGGGPRTTPAIAGGFVYSLGGTGELVAVDGSAGSVAWRVNAVAATGGKVPEWGESGSPVVWRDRVIVNPGADPAAPEKRGVAAFDRATGKQLWAAGGSAGAYASPQVVTLNGKEQVVVFDADGLGGHDPETGAELWRHPWKSAMGMNSAQPVPAGPDRLLVSSEVANGVALLSLTGGKPSEAWHTRALAARFTTPVVYSGHAYGLSDGRLTCVNLADGKRLWREGDYGNGQILRAGDKLVITAEKGFLALVAADPSEWRELGRFPLFGDRTWNMPALAGKQLFVRNHREMACVELP